MRGVRFGASALGCVLAVRILAGCGEDKALFPEVAGIAGEGGVAGEGGDAGARAGSASGGKAGEHAGTAGESAGDAGESAVAGAGAGGSDASAGDGGEGNASTGRGGGGGSTSDGGTSGTSNAGGLGGASGGGTSGGGGSGGSDYPDQLDICVRLTATTALSYDLTMAYENTMIADCRANWVTELYFDPSEQLNARAPFLNTLITWNLRLWGCQATLPVNFPLIYQADGPVPVITRGDAQALIDSYIAVADDLLGLSPSERADMRALISHLSETALIGDSDELSRSACSENTGGASGSGGAAGSAGTAGSTSHAGGAAGTAGSGGAAGSDGAGAGGVSDEAGGQPGANGG